MLASDNLISYYTLNILLEKSSPIRVTIMLDGDSALILRNIQAGVLKNTKRSVSFSRILNIAVGFGLKKPRKDFIEEFEKKHETKAI